ncbi:MAG: amidohydrolase family protein [Halioglobus sp.]
MSSSTFDFVDAHHHLWDLDVIDYPWLNARGEKRFFGDPTAIQKNYLPADFLGESSYYKPSQSVHVQVGVATGSALSETAWLQSLKDVPSAIVAFAELDSQDLPGLLDEQLCHDRVRGIRQIVGRHPAEDLKHGSDALLDNPQWLKGLRRLADMNLSFDLQLIPPQMERAYEVLKRVPSLKVVLCHCGSPWDQSAQGLQNWREGLRRFKQLPNVYCKVSGLGMFNPDWETAQLRPIVLDVIDIFGPERTMFGSNFPVDKLYRSYDTLWTAYDEITQSFSPTEKQQLFVETAKAFYRI